jgi:hypothetical protein
MAGAATEASARTGGEHSTASRPNPTHPTRAAVTGSRPPKLNHHAAKPLTRASHSSKLPAQLKYFLWGMWIIL